MSDLIDRQAAIDRINKQREHLQPDIYPQDKIGDAAYLVCAEFIERLPSAQPETRRWIPCSERLPEPYHRVILTIRGTDVIKMEEGETLEEALKRNMERNMQQYWVTIGYLADDGWNGVDGFPLIAQQIAWMEFPEPWREYERAD